MIANHGRVAKYDHEFEGRNSRLDSLQAAILDVKLRYLDVWIDHRQQVADTYFDVLYNSSDIILPVKQDWVKQAYHLFVVRHSKRDNLRKVLENAGIQTGIHYPIALPKLKAFQYLNQDKEAGFCWTEDVKLLSLPIGEHVIIPELKSILEEIF
jgi:dTDP-4-amino-4,6-dideoxygalactose transaminase